MRRTLKRHRHFIIGFLIGLMLSYLIPEDALDNQHDAAGNCPHMDTVDDQKFGQGFEPHLNLINKPLSAKKRIKTVIRPRYYSSELGIREKLFIGVMTSQENINTYATGINKTAAHLVNKIKFFINADNVKTNFKLKNIVGFTDTRENLRPFHILKYIADNYLDDYDYFLIIPDTVYVDAKKLKSLLYHISVSFDVYMGGINNNNKNNKNKKNSNEFSENVNSADNDGGINDLNNFKIKNNININIENEHNYCDLNAGIVLSSSVIRKMRTNLDWCVRNAITNVHSINIGRCVKYSTKLSSCQESFQEIQIKSYEFEKVNLYKDLKVLEKDSEFCNSTLIYPLTGLDDFYILHAFFSKLHLQALREQSANLQKQIYNTANGTIPNEILEIEWPIGAIPVSMPETRHDIIPWQFINRTHIFMPNHLNAIELMTKIEIEDLDRILNLTIQFIKRKYNMKGDETVDEMFGKQDEKRNKDESKKNQMNSIIIEKIHSIYRRFDPVRGMDYHFHFVFSESSTNKRQIKSFHVVKPLGRVEIIPTPYVTESTKIAILLPTFEHQIQNAEDFVNLYEKICMLNQDNTFLMLIFLYNNETPSKGDSDPYRNIKQLALDLTTKYKLDGSRIAWASIRLPSKLSEISTNSENIMLSSIYAKYEILSVAVTDLTLPKIGLDALVLLGSNTMTFKADFLNRVRMNTIQGFQIFSPIAFMLYPCKAFNFCKECDTCDVSEGTGYFDKFNYDVISFYSKDYVEARKKLESSLPIIRNDNDIEILFNRTKPLNIRNVLDLFVKSEKKLHILRGIEPNLRYGNTIKNYLKKNGSVKNLPKCPYRSPVSLNSDEIQMNSNVLENNNIPNRYNENKYENLLNIINKDRDEDLENNCIHVAAKKHIGEAIVRYRDKVEKGRN